MTECVPLPDSGKIPNSSRRKPRARVGAVLSAVELALECGKPSKEHVLNLLGRLTEEPPPKPIPIPKGLRLTLEPQANVNRYDSLRRAHDAA